MIFVSGANGVLGFVPGKRRIRFRRKFIGVRERRLRVWGCFRRRFGGFGIRYSFLEIFRGGSGGLRRIGVGFGGGVEAGRGVGGYRCFVHVGRLAEGWGFGQGGDGTGGTPPSQSSPIKGEEVREESHPSPAAVGSVNSQTKCNTLVRCWNGEAIWTSQY